VQQRLIDRAHFIYSTAATLVAAGCVAAPAQSLPNGKRSLWVWQTPLSDAGDIAAFAQRNGFSPILLSVVADERSAFEAGDATALGALGSLKRAGLTVYAVAGDPSWVKRERGEPPESVRKLLDAHAAHGAFDGLAIDLEPHTLPEWKDETEKPGLADRYVRLLALIHGSAQSANLPVLATVHPAYAKCSTPSSNGETLLESAARAVDATDLMAYRNAETTLESFADLAMRQLANVGKPWWLGVSTHTGSPAGTSYATLPAAQFFPDIDATASDLQKRYGRGFTGISVEDYRNTVALLQRVPQADVDLGT
jgi:hypothetical protein